jgi:hypothetical protein
MHTQIFVAGVLHTTVAQILCIGDEEIGCCAAVVGETHEIAYIDLIT